MPEGSLTVPLLVLLVILLLCIAIACAAWIVTRRRRALALWAKTRSLGFSPDRNYELDCCFPDFECLHRGRSRHAFNIVSGRIDGREITAFDYRYATGSGKNRQTHDFSAVIVTGPLEFKPLYIRREGFFDRITEFFGADDIDLDSPEFSRKFLVKSPDRKWARDVLGQRMMDYLLGGPEFAIQFAGESIIAWAERRLTPDDFQAAFDLIAGVLDRLPEHLAGQDRAPAEP